MLLPTLPEGTREMIRDIATDEDGQQWGLVIRLTPMPSKDVDVRVSRLEPVRWVRWNATPFAGIEIVTPNAWEVVEDPGFVP